MCVGAHKGWKMTLNVSLSHSTPKFTSAGRLAKPGALRSSKPLQSWDWSVLTLSAFAGLFLTWVLGIKRKPLCCRTRVYQLSHLPSPCLPGLGCCIPLPCFYAPLTFLVPLPWMASCTNLSLPHLAHCAPSMSIHSPHSIENNYLILSCSVLLVPDITWLINKYS